MMHDDPLARRYPDLVPSGGATDADPRLNRLISDLEAVYSNNAPPLLTERIASAIQARADQLARQPQSSHMSSATSEQPPTAPSRSTRRGMNTTSQIPALRRSRQEPISMSMTPTQTTTRKRLSTLAACAAALIVVALIGGLLYSMRGAGGNNPGSGGDFQTRFQRLGGVQIVLEGGCPSKTTACPSIAADIPIIEQRLASQIKATDLNIFVNGMENLVVEIIGQPNMPQTLALIRTTGQLDILDTGSTQLAVGTDVSGQTCQTTCAAGQYKIVFTGAQLDPHSIAVALDPQTNQPAVSFAFAGAARAAFASYTKNNVGNFLTITRDNRVIESATIQSEIDGAAQITGIPSQQDARDLATLLKYGALPVPLTVIHITTVKPGTPAPVPACATPTATPMPPITPTATPGQTSSATATPGATPTPVPTNDIVNTGIPTPTPVGGDGCATPTPPPTPTAIPTAAPGNPGGIPTPTPPATPTATPGQ